MERAPSESGLPQSLLMPIDPLPKFRAAGECVTHLGWRHCRECLPVDKLIVATHGVFHLRCEDKEVRLETGRYLLVPAGRTWEGTSQARAGECFRWIMFRATEAPPATCLPIPVQGDAPPTPWFQSLFDRLLQSIADPSVPPVQRQMLTAAILTEIAQHNMSYSSPRPAFPEHGRAHDVASQAILFMKARLHDALDLPALSDRLQLHPIHVRRLFKQATGMTPARYHQRLQIEAAKKRLEENATVAQAAQAFGFSDASYFSRVFKRCTGYWPSEHGEKQAAQQNVDGEFYPFVTRF